MSQKYVENTIFYFTNLARQTAEFYEKYLLDPQPMYQLGIMPPEEIDVIKVKINGKHIKLPGGRYQEHKNIIIKYRGYERSIGLLGDIDYTPNTLISVPKEDWQEGFELANKRLAR